MGYDYSKLIGRIAEICGTNAIFAKRMNMSERSVSLKLNNIRPWKQPQMEKAAEVLDFPVEEIQAYFFALEVQKN